jgi:dolichyl-phosphate beta-glucosyltransferase
MGIELSLIIPAFNEAQRLGPFLERVIAFGTRYPSTVEVLVVDDGSRDGTADLAASFAGGAVAVSVIRLERNHGKGYAVARGMLQAEGEICVLLDADGSVEPTEIDANLRYVQEEGYDLFVGSRVLRGADQVLVTRWHRRLIGSVLNAFVHALLRLGVRDTQCGFKMFSREAAHTLFALRLVDGYAFDIEVLCLARRLGYRIKEGPVSWRHVSGSKVNVATDSLRMLVSIFQVRSRDRRGALPALRQEPAPMPAIAQPLHRSSGSRH